MADYSRFDATEIKTWTSTVFERLGVPGDDASMATDARIHADLRPTATTAQNVATNQNSVAGVTPGAVTERAGAEIEKEQAPPAPIDGKTRLGPVASKMETTRLPSRPPS